MVLRIGPYGAVLGAIWCCIGGPMVLRRWPDGAV